MLWQLRNLHLFQEDFQRPALPWEMVMHRMRCIQRAHQSITSRVSSKSECVHVRWVPPHLDWVCLNTDGASKIGSDITGFGGFIRRDRK